MRKQFRIYALCIALLNLGSPRSRRPRWSARFRQSASSTRAADLALVNAALARDQVRDQMIALGVDAAVVDVRVARLRDTELRTLADRMQQIPAGGDALAVIGIVFVCSSSSNWSASSTFQEDLSPAGSAGRRRAVAARAAIDPPRALAGAVRASLLALLLVALGSAAPGRQR